jgi:hypothetical protein
LGAIRCGCLRMMPLYPCTGFVHLQSGHPRHTFGVVCANVLRGPLIELQPRLAAYVQPGGLLILSGILQEQVSQEAPVCVRTAACDDGRRTSNVFSLSSGFRESVEHINGCTLALQYFENQLGMVPMPHAKGAGILSLEISRTTVQHKRWILKMCQSLSEKRQLEARSCLTTRANSKSTPATDACQARDPLYIMLPWCCWCCAQVPDVMAAYGGLFDVAHVKTDGQWAAVAAVRT